MARSNKIGAHNDQQPYLDLEWTAFWNKGLFADNYLENRLTEEPEWQAVDGVEEAFQTIKSLYTQKAARFTARTNEAQTEHDFIQPVLDLLWNEPADGDCYQVQVRIPHSDLQRQPDYAFFRSAGERQNAQPLIGSADYWRDVPCLGDAKKWTASLDKDRAADENPTAQICNYLYRARVRWGILTNGKLWRLYERERSSAGGIYYEVDLEHILQRGDKNAFKYFLLFFRRAAFLPDAAGITFVDKVFQGSVDYAAQVGNRLKESVYDALRFLMNGFLGHGANALDSQDPVTLNRVHENALIVLYRLLFLLFAEDRELLPRKEQPYASYSLYRLQREINDCLRAGTAYPPQGHRFWSELTNLFELIDQGFPKGGIPAYNGGLFSPAKYPHIAHTAQPGVTRWELGDHYLAQAIDLLAYDRERWDQPGARDVDYATLAVQHLGSIYEGLLELQPHRAAEALIETLEDGKPIFKPARAVDNPRPVRGQPPRQVAEGELYLITNRGERKATGSYYTPKYIVDYIVEHTVGPLAKEAAEKAAAALPAVAAEVAGLEKTRAQWEKQAKNGKAPLARKEIAKLNQEIDRTKRRLLEFYLDLKVLDPAMGSGHFLVGAADFLSLAMANDPSLPHDLPGEDPQAFYKRLVVERCLYGVDLNPLAVELAKLSLWLHTVSSNKALSFLDHHLRCGNSLIGARIEEDLKREPPQFNARGRRINTDAVPLFAGFDAILTLAHLQGFLDAFRQIVDQPSGDAVGERNKAAVYDVMDRERDKFRTVAHCWLAPYFGVPVTPPQYEQVVRALCGPKADSASMAAEPWFQAAKRVAAEEHFFHWELEFPEVFFDRHGLKREMECGFDAVIGNPPYVSFGLGRTDKLDESHRHYFEERFSRSAEYKISVYALFIEKAGEAARVKGRFGLILPDSFLTGRYFSKVRRYLVTETEINPVVRFNKDFWESGDVGFPVVLISTRMPSEWKVQESSVSFAECSSLDELPNRLNYSEQKQIEWAKAFRNRFRLIPNPVDRQIIARVEGVVEGVLSVPLGTILEMHHGVRSKVGRDRVVSKTPSGPTWKAGLVGSDEISRYSLWWDGNYINIEPPLLFQGGWDEDDIKQPKILIRRTGDRIIATVDEGGLFHTNALIYGIKASGATNRHPLNSVVALLNSRLFAYYYDKTAMKKGRTLPQIEIDTLEQLPIREIALTTPSGERTQQLGEAKQLYERALVTTDDTGVLKHVEDQLAQRPARADVVEDLLAFLAEQMIALNSEKQPEVAGFLTWLARKIGAAVDDLTNKTRVRAYHDHDLTGLLAVLRQNRRKLRIDPDARATQEAIDREFSTSVEKLTPLKANIAATDRLIDQIVYRLYGLTGEEIAIVEGTSPEQETGPEEAV